MVERVRVEVPVPPDVRVTRVVVKEVTGPAGSTLADRATVAAKPFRLVRVIVDVVDVPA